MVNIEGDADSKAMQGIANYSPDIAQRIFKNREMFIYKEQKPYLAFLLFPLYFFQ